MSEEEKIRDYLNRFYAMQPKAFIDQIDVKSRGTFVILKYLSHTADEVCAGDISKRFGVSTARIAVALRTLKEKGLIETATSATDKRKTTVWITENGLSVVEKGEEELIAFGKMLVREIGAEDLEHLFRILSKISRLMEMECTTHAAKR